MVICTVSAMGDEYQQDVSSPRRAMFPADAITSVGKYVHEPAVGSLQLNQFCTNNFPFRSKNELWIAPSVDLKFLIPYPSSHFERPSVEAAQHPPYF